MGQAAFHYEFFGPYIGPIGIILGLPAVCFGLVAACNSRGCTDWSLHPPQLPASWQLFSSQATLVLLCWILLQAAIWLILPGKRAQGVVLKDGTRLTYKLTGKPGLPVSFLLSGDRDH